jgi:hypothetical protein
MVCNRFFNGTNGYVGTGQDSTINKKDFWEWDQTYNNWTQKTDFGGTERKGSVAFSLNAKGYIGTGDDPYYKDFWEYDPAADNISEISENTQIFLYPNPSADNIIIENAQQTTIEILDIQGQLINTLAVYNNKIYINVSALLSGMYFVKFKAGEGIAVKKFIKE